MSFPGTLRVGTTGTTGVEKRPVFFFRGGGNGRSCNREDQQTFCLPPVQKELNVLKTLFVLFITHWELDACPLLVQYNPCPVYEAKVLYSVSKTYAVDISNIAQLLFITKCTKYKSLNEGDSHRNWFPVAVIHTHCSRCRKTNHAHVSEVPPRIHRWSWTPPGYLDDVQNFVPDA